MDMGVHDFDVIYFRGRSVDNGPAWGARTLFVTRHRPAAEILQYRKDARHICFCMFGMSGGSDAARGDGPNTTDPLGGDDPTHYVRLGRTVETLLKEGLWVTVEYDAHRHAKAAQRLTRVWSHERFIPQALLILAPADTAPNFTLKVGLGRGLRQGFWTQALRDADRTRAWAPFRAKPGREIVARTGDLI